MRRLVKHLFSLLRKDPQTPKEEFDLAKLPALLGREDPVILDIGCNDGTQTLAFWRLFKDPKVYSFEPDARARDRFQSKVTDSRAKLFDVAISAADGEAAFYVSSGLPPGEWSKECPKGWDLSGSIRKPKEHLNIYPWCIFPEVTRVKTKRLDTWCQEEGVHAIDFIWADVQGAEKNLIEGGHTALRHTRYFYTEYSDHELYEGQASFQTLLELLPEFEVVRKFTNDVLLKNKRLE